MRLRVNEALQSRTLWLIVAWCLIVVTITLLWRNSRADVDRNARVIAAQRQLIANHRRATQFLCSTISTLRILIVQEKATLQIQLSTQRMSHAAREQLATRVATLQVAQYELSNQRPCKEVQ